MITTPHLWRLRLFYANPPNALVGKSELHDMMYGTPEDPADKGFAETIAKDMLRECEDLVRVEVLHPERDEVHSTFFANDFR